MAEGNWSGSKRGVQEWHVTEDGNESSLEEEREVGSVVNHALLGDGQVSGLADQQVGPLHAHNGDKVTSLGVEEGLERVANDVLGHSGVDVEIWDGVTWQPSALGPCLDSSVDEEETDIVSVLDVGDPIEGLGIWHLTIVGINIGLADSVTLAWKVSWVIDIVVVWSVSLLDGSELVGATWSDTVVMHDVVVSEETSSSLDNTDLEVCERDQFDIHQVVSVSITWVTVHDIKLSVLIGEGNGWHHIGSEINAENEHGGEWLWDINGHEEDEW